MGGQSLYLIKKSSLILAHNCGEFLERAYIFFINMLTAPWVNSFVNKKLLPGRSF
jgi:hypothetical protein